MRIRRDFITIALAVFCLMATLSMVKPIGSQPQTKTYDPFVDLNNDGTIDIYDAIIFASFYGTNGTPIADKSALLDQQSQIDRLNASLNELQSKMDSLNASLTSRISSLETMITQMNATITMLQSTLDDVNDTLSISISVLEGQVANVYADIPELQNTTATLNASLTEDEARIDDLSTSISTLSAQLEFLKSDINGTLNLIWDSEWYGPLATGDTVIVFNKTLDITNSVVFMVGKKSLGDAPHQIDYGGIWTDSVDPWHGAYWWNLTPTSITLHRHGNDSNWVYARIMIWKTVTFVNTP